MAATFVAIIIPTASFLRTRTGRAGPPAHPVESWWTAGSRLRYRPRPVRSSAARPKDQGFHPGVGTTEGPRLGGGLPSSPGTKELAEEGEDRLAGLVRLGEDRRAGLL